ncbi:VOC family protein [Primorskyibacter sp. 2E107]|uniref:VOC family protein n=1 Tax=Primorskyibacter sp. 2E107 TaxID=3403458 RepID=UPI003AF77242
MPPAVQSLDHLVLTVADIARTCAFYQTALGMQIHGFDAADGSRRTALIFGSQKVNLHHAGHEFEPKAKTPKPGSADLCFLSDAPLVDWLAHLSANGICVEKGR